MAQIVEQIVPNSKVALSGNVGPDLRNYRVSCDKIRRVLPNFRPQWDALKGAKQLYDTYRQSALSLGDFEGPRYQRISHIKKLLADGSIRDGLRANFAREGASLQRFGERGSPMHGSHA